MEIPSETSEPYEKYRALGGIINEEDCKSARARATRVTTLNNALISQATGIAKKAGITLYNSKDIIDPRMALYGVLRTDARPEGVKHHHSQMCDQRLFAEALRMLGDADYLEKIIEAYPNISFS